MSRVKNKQYIHFAIAVVIFIVVKLILPVDERGLTAIGASTIALFASAIYLWLLGYMGWTSFLVISLMPFTGICTAAQAFTGSFGNSTTMMILAMALMSCAVNDGGITQKIAIWFITRKAVVKRPYVFFALFMIANMLVGYFMSFQGTVIVFALVAKSVLESLNYTKDDKFSKALYVCSLWITMVASCATPIGHTIPVLIIGIAEDMVGGALSYLKYMSIGIPFSIICLFINLLVIRFVIKPDCTKFNNYNIEDKLAEMKPVTKGGKIAATVYVITILVWLFPDLAAGILPEAAAWVKKFGATLPCFLATGICCFIHADGKPVLDFGKAMKTVPWTAVSFIASVMLISGLLTNEAGGVSIFLGNVLGELTTVISPGMFAIIMFLFAAIMTNFASNTVTGTLAMSAALPLFIANPEYNIPIFGFTVLISICCNLAFLTPAACGAVSVTLQDGYISISEVFKYGLCALVLYLIVVIAAVWPVSQLIF